MDQEIALRVDGEERTLTVDTRTTLLDADGRLVIRLRPHAGAVGAGTRR